MQFFRRKPSSHGRREFWLIRWIRFLILTFQSLKPGIQVVALVGSSGTGKSFRARIIADRFKIRYIIDDGILIKDKKILAGRSAKRESAYLSAVKTALFADKVHRFEVKQALERNRCRRVLVLATSVRMLGKICDSLGLPHPGKIIMIEDVASPQEIQSALENRKRLGRHIVPVPAKEVRKNAPQIVTDEIKLWFRLGPFGKDRMYEKTLVRPEFSGGEAVEVPDYLLKQTVRTAIDATIEGIKIIWFRADFSEGYSISLHLSPGEGRGIDTEELKRSITSHVKKQTGAVIKHLEINLREPRNRRQREKFGEVPPETRHQETE